MLVDKKQLAFAPGIGAGAVKIPLRGFVHMFCNTTSAVPILSKKNKNCFPEFKSRAAFTLVELLVVIAIITLLTSISLLSLATARDKSNDARIIMDVSQVRISAEAINRDFDSYQELCCEVAGCGLGTLNEAASSPHGGQLAVIEDDIKTWQKGNISVNCKAAFSSYCFDVNLITAGSGRFCIDSKGYAGRVAEDFTCVTAATTCQ